MRETLDLKQFKICADFSLFAICALLSLSSAISVSGGDVPRGGASKPSTTIPNRFDLHGAVMDATPDLSQETFAKLAASKSGKEFEQNLMAMLDIRPASNVVVSARGTSVTKEAVTDAQGKFKFTGLPHGVYDVSAEMPSRPSDTGVERMAIAKKRADSNTNRSVDLQLHADLVAVRGRITDIHGRPVARAKVTGTPFPFFGQGIPDSVSISSSDDGSYELKGFVPPHTYHLAGYLNGGDPKASQRPFYVDISVEADGFMSGHTRVPTVTEALLSSARRLLKIMNQVEIQSIGKSDIREKEGLELPSSHGNTITGIDIVLKKAGEGSQ